MLNPVARDVPTLGTDECQVWWARISHRAAWHEQLLDPVERQRRERYYRQSDRDRFTLGVALARLILAAHSNSAPTKVVIDRTCVHCGEPHGRPRLATCAELDFSVSHSGDLIVLAVALSPMINGGTGRTVGVDVEQVVPLREPSLLYAALSPDERVTFDRLDAVAQVTAFFRYWVRKEAVLNPDHSR